jgi:hypothetical protein
MKWEEIKPLLAAPFPVESIHWRVGATNKEKTKGIALAYVDARDVMKRLDDVCGAHWQCRYPLSDDGLLICEVGIKIDGEWIWRANGAGSTDVEAEKGKASDAFKRAAVLWGIGQYLYSLPNEWVELIPKGRSYALKSTPSLPSWATPDGVAHMPAKRVNKEQVQQYVSRFLEAIENEDALYMKQMGDELKDTPEHAEVWRAFNTKQKSEIKKILDQLREK